MNAPRSQEERLQTSQIDGPGQSAAATFTAEASDISLLDLVLTVTEHLRLLVLVPLASGIVAWTIGFMMGPVFTASTTFLPPQPPQSAASAMLQQLGGLGTLAGVAAGLKNPNDQYIAFLRSRTIEDALIDRFTLQERYQMKTRKDTRTILEDNTRIGSGKDGLISIDVTDRDPVVAADIANAYVEEFNRLLKTLVVTEAQRRRAFFEGQLTLAKDNLTKAEQALKTSGVNPSALKGRPEAAVSAIAVLQARIGAQEVKLEAMRTYLSEQAPEIRQAQSELASLKAQLEKVGQPSGPSSGDGDYIARYRDFKYQETMFELMARQFEIARVDESREGNVVQVIDKAVPPERRSGPKRARMAIITALAVGFVLLLWVFLRQAVREARLRPESAERVSRLASSLRRSLGRT